MSVAATYANELSRQFRFLATWPIGMPLTLGTVGEILDDRIFDPTTSLESFGVAFKPVTGDTEPQPFTYQSKGVRGFGLSTGAEIPDIGSGALKARAKLSIHFDEESAILFRAAGLTHKRIADQPKLSRDIVRLMDERQWSADWFVVTHVLEAESATIMISSSSDATVEVALGGDARAAGVDLLDVRFEPRVVRQHEMNTVILNSTGSTPLFRAKRVRKKWFNLFGEQRLEAKFATDTSKLDRSLDDAEFEDELLEEIIVYDAL